MSQSTRPAEAGLAALLTYAGTLPFIACAALAWLDASARIAGLAPADTTLASITLASITLADIAVAYGAVIASFIAGTHWAARVYRHEVSALPTLVMSNAFALLAWLALLLPQRVWGPVLLIACFAGLLAVDAGLRRGGVLPAWFWPLRRNATLIVCAMLALTAYATAAQAQGA